MQTTSRERKRWDLPSLTGVADWLENGFSAWGVIDARSNTKRRAAIICKGEGSERKSRCLLQSKDAGPLLRERIGQVRSRRGRNGSMRAVRPGTRRRPLRRQAGRMLRICGIVPDLSARRQSHHVIAATGPRFGGRNGTEQERHKRPQAKTTTTAEPERPHRMQCSRSQSARNGTTSSTLARAETACKEIPRATHAAAGRWRIGCRRRGCWRTRSSPDAAG